MPRKEEGLLERRIGRKLAFYRRRRGLTQDQFAEILEVDLSTVSRYECGHAMPPIRKLMQICKLLHTTASDILDERPPSKSKEGVELLAIIEPLAVADRKFAIKMMKSLAAHLQSKRTASSKK